MGIPYGILNGIDKYVVFITCFLANALVFPLMLFFLERINGYMLRWYSYKKAAIFVARRAKLASAKKIHKYGFWGLIFFVMIPLPGTGVYAGSIATYLFGIDRSNAFVANTIGLFLSSLIIWSITVLSLKGA